MAMMITSADLDLRPPPYEQFTGTISIRQGRAQEVVFHGQATVWFRHGSNRKRIVLFIDRRPVAARTSLSARCERALYRVVPDEVLARIARDLRGENDLVRRRR